MFSRTIATLSSILILGLGLCAQAQEMGTYQPDIARALDSAGSNRAELEKVLSHYRTDLDTLKYRAAYFLIANMEGHSYVTYMLCDTNKAEIPFSVQDYSTFDELTAAFDTLQAQRGDLDFKKKDLTEDLKVVTADFLTDHIDLAFQAWREKPWAKKLSFEQFCSSVLPYRGSNEPPERWREFFLDRYADLPSKMKDSTDPIEAASLINQDIMSWFTFDQRYYFHPTDQGLSEMRASGLGRCEDMTNLAIYGMRALGLAVTSDYTPYWANSGNNHAWNAIVTPDGKVIPFMGAEANPGSYHLVNKLAKVYRKTYEMHPENLIFQTRKQQKVPGWLAGKSYIDVTRDYVDTRDVSIKLTKPVPDTVDIAYLCVFNSGEWQAIHWARIDNGQALFTDMGTDVAYLPSFCEQGGTVPAGTPFILQSDGQTAENIPDKADTIQVDLTSCTNARLESSTDGIERTRIKPGTVYELLYWDDGWQSLGKSTAADSSVSFCAVPSGAFYWLQPEGSKREERIFTIENGAQVWW